MSDPFSVTGSAVGVASLGLTICQGFLAYYGPYKSFYEDIEEVYSRFVSLDNLMTVLHKTVRESPMVVSVGSQANDLATQSINQCQSGLQRLKKMLNKCHTVCAANDENVSKFKAQLNRLLYPFRQDTLVKLMDTVTWLHSNVDTSLQILQMTSLNVGHHSLNLILSKSSSAASNTSTIIQELGIVGQKNSGIDMKLAAIARKIDQMESHMRNTNGRPITTPSLLQSLLDYEKETDEESRDLIPKKSKRTHRKSQSLVCRCETNSFPARHKPWCTARSQSREREILLLSVRRAVCNKLLRFSVAVSLSVTKGAGGLSISPTLQFRAVVPDNSPAFKLLSNASPKFWLPQDMRLIRKTHHDLFQLFEKGLASPSDTLQNGDTLLHVLAEWHYWSEAWNDDQWADWQAFLDDLLAAGIVTSSLDTFRRTPADIVKDFYDHTSNKAMHSSHFAHTVRTCVKLLNAGSFMTYNAIFPSFFTYHQPPYVWSSDISDRMQRSENHTLLLLWAIVEKVGTQDLEIPNELLPLLLRSVDGLRSFLDFSTSRASPWFVWYARWPAGLAVLLEKGYCPTEITLAHAFDAQCVPSIEMILQCSRFDLWWDALYLACYQRDPAVRTLIVKEFVARRTRLTVLAEMHLTVAERSELDMGSGHLLNHQAARACALLRAKGVNVSGVEERATYSVYHPSRLSFDICNQLWDAGFRDLGEDDRTGFAYLIAEVYDVKDIAFLLEKTEWLISRGVDIHMNSGRTPLIHQLGSLLGSVITKPRRPPMSEQCIQLFHKVILDDHRDECDCYCVFGGCFAFKKILDRVWRMKAYYRIPKFQRNPLLSMTLQTIGGTLTPGKERSFYEPIARSVIRYLTFCDLDLTHTCCQHGVKDMETMAEIHEEEADLVTQLECLVEEFTQAWEDTSFTFLQFLREVWKPRMDEILSDRLDEEEVIELRRIGVTVQQRDDVRSWRSLLH
ncbi:hypothetical protein BJX64DRAFT_266727 [Aspergillus heterothallicus]